MNEEVKKKWLEALRGGEYVQGTSCLVDSKNRFCCLGVLCDLYLLEVGDGWEHKPVDNSYFCYEGSGSLPLRVQEWADLSSDPYVYGTKLSVWNDAKLKTFKQIADMIEEAL